MSRTSSFPAALFSISFYYDHHLSKEAKMLNQNILKELSPLSPYASASESHRHWIWTEESATFFSFILFTCLIDCVAFQKKKREATFFSFILFTCLTDCVAFQKKQKKGKEGKKREKKEKKDFLEPRAGCHKRRRALHFEPPKKE